MGRPAVPLVEREPDELLEALREAEQRGDLHTLEAVVAALEDATRWRPEPYQVAPGGEWRLWAFVAGRFAGKTDACSHWLDEHMTGPPCDTRVPGGHRAGIIAPTLGDAVEASVTGISGVIAHNPGVEKVNRKEGSFAIWPNGAEARLFGAHTEEDVQRLRAGGNRCALVFEEFAAMRHLRAAFDHGLLGLRVGRDPRAVAATTPKGRPELQTILQDPKTVVTRATSFDNPHISRLVIDDLRRRYEGTRLGRQELYAEVLDDYEGALWQRGNIDRDRITEYPEDIEERLAFLGIVRVLVGIDPSTWDPDLGDDPGSVGQGLETGIVVVGIDGASPPHLYVLDDLSMRGQPEAWARAACSALHTWRAASLVPETNAGGGLVLSTIRLVDPNVPIYREGKRVGVRAAVGKRARAEPVAMLSEQGRWHHVGYFPELEGQMCQWDPRESWSPDRIDAMVWPAVALHPESSAPASSSASSLLAAGSLTRRR